ncbi:MAG: gamma carbonic anhydrase family protein [Bacteroidota bacterium]|jgi:carbonic anhydrase/acetyltransferase-like protein (isoleucine patch superfamily)
MMGIIPYKDRKPALHASVFVADGAKIIGDVEFGEHSGIWFNAVIRGDMNFIHIGSRTNVQDNSVLNVTSKTAPLNIGSNVTIGHSVILHGCTIDDCCLIGMSAVVLDKVHVHQNSMIAAGAIVLEGFDVPEGMLVVGIPATGKRALTEEEKQFIRQSATNYVGYIQAYQS